jgi:hypothetical protein
VCTYITLIAATDDLDRLNAALATLDRRGQVRRAERIDTPGLRPLLAADEREYLISRNPCDCGAFLGSALQQGEDPPEARAAEIARYRRRGWSEARIARAMTDKARADARPAGRTPNEDAAYWIDLLTTLSRELELNRLALMHHFYSKSPGNEPEIATRRKAGRMREAAEVLASMGDAVIHDFETGEALR